MGMRVAEGVSAGSVSKDFTAAAILQLVADGTLSLDDRVGDYVADLDGPVASASIESLLLHASGLVRSHGQDHTPLTRDDAVAAIGGLDVDRSAQGPCLYSDAGVHAARVGGGGELLCQPDLGSVQP